MLRTILFGSALLACLVVGRVTAQWPDLAAAPVPVARPATAVPSAPTPRPYFTANRIPTAPSAVATNAGL